MFSNAFGEITPNNAFILDGSGYAVTEETIEISELDLVMLTGQRTGSVIKAIVEDGFIILGNHDFLVTDLQTTFLREGKYIRINGNVENESGDEAAISFFGRLIEESKTASVYGFTGRITSDGNYYKIIYTTKLSKLEQIETTPTETKTSNNLTIHILRGASSQGADSYVGNISGSYRLEYFSQDRIVVEPGTTITITNSDTVSHSIKSGTENYGDRYNQFTPDGRISTEEILPGKSVSITFDKPGFYRLYDPEYQWMKIVVYAFPKIDNTILGNR